MGILASDQITITDVTDGYAVILTSETYTFVENSSGGTKNQSCTTEVIAYCGSNQCSVPQTEGNYKEDRHKGLYHPPQRSSFSFSPLPETSYTVFRIYSLYLSYPFYDTLYLGN